MTIEKILSKVIKLIDEENNRIFFDFDDVDRMCDNAHFISHFGNTLRLHIRLNRIGLVKMKMKYFEEQNCYQLLSLKLPKKHTIRL